MIAVIKLSSLALLISLTACSIKPEDIKSSQVLPDHYAAPVSTSADELSLPPNWYEQYGDQELNRLVELAISGGDAVGAAGNAQLQSVLARLSQSKAVYAQLRASQSASLGIGMEHKRQSINLNGTRAHSSDSSLSAIAQYEFDVWGRLSNQANSGLSRYLASHYNVEIVRRGVINRVVGSYWLLRELEMAEQLLNHRIDARNTQLEMMSSRWRLGAGTVLDVTQARAEVAGLERQRIDVQSNRAQAERALSLLTGVPDLKVAARETVPTPVKLPSTGMPSDLLYSRADVLQAEALLNAAGFDVASARAALFPSVNLQAQGGEQSVSLGNLMGSGTSFWGLGLKVDLALFDRGLRKAKIMQSRAEQREMVVAYQESIHKAFKDVSNALIINSSLEYQLPWLNQELESAAEAMEMAQLQYDAGRLSYAQLLDVRQALDTARRDQIKVQFAMLINQADLVHALGF